MLSELRTSKLSPHKYYELCEFLFQIHLRWIVKLILFFYYCVVN
jgi:hypothetical protein